jgi:hypothetical protein
MPKIIQESEPELSDASTDRHNPRTGLCLGSIILESDNMYAMYRLFPMIDGEPVQLDPTRVQALFDKKKNPEAKEFAFGFTEFIDNRIFKDNGAVDIRDKGFSNDGVSIQDSWMIVIAKDADTLMRALSAATGSVSTTGGPVVIMHGSYKNGCSPKSIQERQESFEIAMRQYRDAKAIRTRKDKKKTLQNPNKTTIRKGGRIGRVSPFLGAVVMNMGKDGLFDKGDHISAAALRHQQKRNRITVEGYFVVIASRSAVEPTGSASAWILGPSKSMTYRQVATIVNNEIHKHKKNPKLPAQKKAPDICSENSFTQRFGAWVKRRRDKGKVEESVQQYNEFKREQLPEPEDDF